LTDAETAPICVKNSLKTLKGSAVRAFGENLVEKRGWHWALTSFVIESWGETSPCVKSEQGSAVAGGY
jgi:hypothetical protein